jgi:hypothetical protein
MGHVTEFANSRARISNVSMFSTRPGTEVSTHSVSPGHASSRPSGHTLTCRPSRLLFARFHYHACKRNRVGDRRAYPRTPVLQLDRFHACQLDGCDQTGNHSHRPPHLSDDPAAESGARKQSLSRYCRVSSQCWHRITGLCSTGSISPGTLHGRASVTFPHEAQTVCQWRYGGLSFESLTVAPVTRA